MSPRHRFPHRGAWAAGVISLLSIASAVPSRCETREIAPNPHYAASAVHRFWLGEGYRSLWVTPVELEVLDLQKEAGGLRVVRRVGGMQTPGLALAGADGRSYTFRWIDKDPSRLLPKEWRGTVMAEYARTRPRRATRRLAVLIALWERTGYVPFAPQRLVVMPDDPALGEHRELFAGAVGSFGSTRSRPTTVSPVSWARPRSSRARSCGTTCDRDPRIASTAWPSCASG